MFFFLKLNYINVILDTANNRLCKTQLQRNSKFLNEFLLKVSIVYSCVVVYLTT